MMVSNEVRPEDEVPWLKEKRKSQRLLWLALLGNFVLVGLTAGLNFWYSENSFQKLHKRQVEVPSGSPVSRSRRSVEKDEFEYVQAQVSLLTDELDKLSKESVNKEEFEPLGMEVRLLSDQLDDLSRRTSGCVQEESFSLLQTKVNRLAAETSGAVQQEDFMPLKMEVRALSDEVNTFQPQITGLAQDLGKLQEEVRKKIDEKEIFAQLNALKDEVQDLSRSLPGKAEEETVINLQSHLSALSAEIDALRRSAGGKAEQEDVITLQNQVHDLKNTVTLLMKSSGGKADEETVVTLQNEVNAVKSDLQQVLQSTRGKADEEVVAALQAQVDGLAAGTHHHGAGGVEVTGAGATTEELSALTGRLDRLDAQISRLQENSGNTGSVAVDDLQREVEALKVKVNSDETLAAILQSVRNCNTPKKSIEKAVKRIENLEKEAKEHHDDMESLKDRVAEEEKTSIRLTHSLEDQNTGCAGSSTGGNSHSHDELDDLKKRVDEEEKRSQNLTADLIDVHSHVTSIEETLEGVHAKGMTFHQKLDSLTSSIAGVSADNSALQSRLAAVEVDNRKFDTDITAARAEARAARAEVMEELRQSVAALNETSQNNLNVILSLGRSTNENINDLRRKDVQLDNNWAADSRRLDAVQNKVFETEAVAAMNKEAARGLEEAVKRLEESVDANHVHTEGEVHAAEKRIEAHDATISALAVRLAAEEKTSVELNDFKVNIISDFQQLYRKADETEMMVEMVMGKEEEHHKHMEMVEDRVDEEEKKTAHFNGFNLEIEKYVRDLSEKVDTHTGQIKELQRRA